MPVMAQHRLKAAEGAPIDVGGGDWVHRSNGPNPIWVHKLILKPNWVANPIAWRWALHGPKR